MDFHTLCQQLHLGALTAEPTRLYGGLMHKMYRIVTEKGVYAVKHLNPYVMARADALRNFAAAESLERQLERSGLPLLPALAIGGKKLQEIDGHYCYVFPYFDGRALVEGEIAPAHCSIVGTVLAKLHAVQQDSTPIHREILRFDWNSFDLTEEDKTLLQKAQTAANAAVLPPRSTICHNDMDPKNVLWNGMDCRIIDLECLGYNSPYLELLETALCWAGYESGKIDLDRFSSFVRAYITAGGNLDVDWAMVYDANAGRLAWLHYNLLRAAGSEGEEARTAGAAEVAKTLACIRGYAQMQKTLLSIIETIKKEGSV